MGTVKGIALTGHYPLYEDLVDKISHLNHATTSKSKSSALPTSAVNGFNKFVDFTKKSKCSGMNEIWKQNIYKVIVLASKMCTANSKSMI